jgi:hypothetical protein
MIERQAGEGSSNISTAGDNGKLASSKQRATSRFMRPDVTDVSSERLFHRHSTW